MTGGLSLQHTGVLDSREGVGTGWGELLNAISLSASAQGPRERSGWLFPRLLTVVPLVVKFQMDFFCSLCLSEIENVYSECVHLYLETSYICLFYKHLNHTDVCKVKK